MLITFDANVSHVFLYSTLIMLYFNVKYYITYMSLKQVDGFFKSDRKIKLVFATILSVMHLLLYFLTRDVIIGFDGCAMVKTIYILLIT
jgi:hypothetical protein